MNGLSEDLVKDLKQTLSTFKGKSEEIASLQTSIASIEAKLAEVNAYGPRRKDLMEWDNEDHAKKFVEFVRDVHFAKRRDPMDSTTNAGADGGYLVPEEFRSVLLRLIDSFGFVRRTATIFPMSTDTVKFPKLSSGLTVYWTDENAAITGSRPAFTQFTMDVHKLAALVGTSTELIEDSSIAIANLLATLAAEQIAREEDRVGLRGDLDLGPEPYDGILNVAGTSSVTMSSGNTSYTDVTADNLLDMLTTMPSQGLEGARFIFHRSVFDTVRKLKDNNNQYIYNQPANGAPGTIWGYPYELHDLMPATTDAGQNGTGFIILGNMRHLYLADRRRMTAAVSQHYGFASDQMWYRWTERIGFHFPFPTLFTKLVTAAA